MRRRNPPKKADLIPLVVAAGIAYFLYRDATQKTSTPSDYPDEDPKLSDGETGSGDAPRFFAVGVLRPMATAVVSDPRFVSRQDEIYDEDESGNPELDY